MTASAPSAAPTRIARGESSLSAANASNRPSVTVFSRTATSPVSSELSAASSSETTPGPRRARSTSSVITARSRSAPGGRSRTRPAMSLTLPAHRSITASCNASLVGKRCSRPVFE